MGRVGVFKHPPLKSWAGVSEKFWWISYDFMMVNVNVYFLTNRKRFVKILDAFLFGDLPWIL